MNDSTKQKCIDDFTEFLQEFNEEDRSMIINILNEQKKQSLRYKDGVPVVVFEDILEYFEVLLDQIRVCIDVVTYNEDISMKEIKSLFRIQSYMVVHLQNLICKIAKRMTGEDFDSAPFEFTV